MKIDHRLSSRHSLRIALAIATHNDIWSTRARSIGSSAVRVYALVEIGDSQAVDVFVRREDAFQALEDVLNDEPGWAGTLFVAPIELDERDVSEN
jgi:hypothetical protein